MEKVKDQVVPSNGKMEQGTQPGRGRGRGRGGRVINAWTPRFSSKQLQKRERICLIVQHRIMYSEIHKKFSKLRRFGNGIYEPMMPWEQFVRNNTVNQAGRVARSWEYYWLEGITIREMIEIHTQDRKVVHFKELKIELEIIDDLSYIEGFMAVGQDENGDVAYVSLEAVKARYLPDPIHHQKIGYGTKISIAHPAVVFPATEEEPMKIEVGDETELLVHLERDFNKCRFCSKPNSTKTCSSCHVASYCSKNCQEQDCRLLKHTRVCKVYQDLHRISS